jgi:hypothetical protein
MRSPAWRRSETSNASRFRNELRDADLRGLSWESSPQMRIRFDADSVAGVENHLRLVSGAR